MTDKKLLRILSGLTAILLLTTIYLFHRTTVLNSRLGTLGRSYSDHLSYDYDPDKYLKFQHFKEDYYIKQQDNNTKLIIAVFAILVTITGAVTYKVGQDRILALEDKQNKQNERQEAKYKELQNFIEDTQAKLNYETYYLRVKDAENSLKEGWKQSYIVLILSGLDHLSKSYLYQKRINSSLAGGQLEQLIDYLKEIAEFILSNPLEVDKENKGFTKSLFHGINEVENSVVTSLLGDIQLHVKYLDS